MLQFNFGFIGYEDIIIAKGENVAIRIHGLEDHEPYMVVKFLKDDNDLWTARNYIPQFEIFNKTVEEYKNIAEAFENKEVNIFDCLSDIGSDCFEFILEKYLEDDCKDWDYLQRLLMEVEDTPVRKSLRLLLEEEYKKSLGTMMDWTTSEDEGFTFLSSDSNWHFLCGTHSIHKCGDYIVDLGSKHEFNVGTLTSAKWLAEAIVRGFNCVKNDEVISEHRVGCGISGNWYCVEGYWTANDIFKNGDFGRITITSYEVEGDCCIGHIIKDKAVVSREDYLRQIDKVTEEVSRW